MVRTHRWGGTCGGPEETAGRLSERRDSRGFTLIELLIVIAVLAVLLTMAVPNYLTSRKSANEASAINSMRALVVAEENYRIAKGSQGYVNLATLKASKLVDPALGAGSRTGYTFITFGTPGASTFAFTAIHQDNAGDRCFYVDQTGVIRTAEDELVDASSPSLK
jgi:type IV pilus assembly protein PilA